MDKVLHFAAGLIIALAVGWGVSPPVGLIAGMGAGVLKEIWDEWAYSGADPRDMLVTFGGAVMGFVML